MPQENVEIICQLTALSNGGDWSAGFQYLAPDIEWIVAKEHPEARSLSGLAAVAEYERQWRETLPDMRFELDQLVDADDKVVCIGSVRGTGVGSGADVRVPIAIVFTLQDGLIVRGEEYLNPTEALEAVGLEE